MRKEQDHRASVEKIPPEAQEVELTEKKRVRMIPSNEEELQKPRRCLSRRKTEPAVSVAF